MALCYVVISFCHSVTWHGAVLLQHLADFNCFMLMHARFAGGQLSGHPKIELMLSTAARCMSHCSCSS